MVPRFGLLTEVIGAAKADLKAGTLIDGGGGYTVYAQNDLASVAKKEGCVPFGLLDGARLIKDVKVDQVITFDMVELKTDTLIYHLRKIQDQLIPPTEKKSWERTFIGKEDKPWPGYSSVFSNLGGRSA